MAHQPQFLDPSHLLSPKHAMDFSLIALESRVTIHQSVALRNQSMLGGSFHETLYHLMN